VAPTFLLRWTGSRVSLWSTTGVVSWETDDSTDLDYSPLPLATRNNNEQATQFTQEVRVASNSAAALTGAVNVSWQAGVSFFTQGYDQDALNNYAPFLLNPQLGLPVTEQTDASLDDRGVGLYGEATFGIGSALEARVGVRGDFETKEADITTAYDPLIAGPAVLQSEADFNDVSPQFTVSYRATPSAMVYGTVARGFKAGGFNPSSPLGSEPYDEEHSWSYEGGVKTLWLENRLSANLSVFYIDWSDMQLNVPNPFAPGAFYVDNVANATSTGMELEMNARVAAGCDLFAGLGFIDATFGDASFVGATPVSGLRVPNTPRYTADIGGQYSVAVAHNATAFVRAEFTFRGSMFYDDTNTTEQEAYSVANFRAGVRTGQYFIEAWTRNVFDTEYVPLAFFYPFAASGFIGEPGAPRTFGVRVGATF
jgi:iron complex outermembrane receptor protein